MVGEPENYRSGDTVMDRRTFVGGTGFAFLCGTNSSPAQPRFRRVGVIAPSTASKEAITARAFFERMRELGWIENSNVVFAGYYADDRQNRLPELAAELMASSPDVVFAVNAPAAVEASKATRTIPIVFGTASDPANKTMACNRLASHSVCGVRCAYCQRASSGHW